MPYRAVIFCLFTAWTSLSLGASESLTPSCDESLPLVLSESAKQEFISSGKAIMLEDVAIYLISQIPDIENGGTVTERLVAEGRFSDNVAAALKESVNNTLVANPSYEAFEASYFERFPDGAFGNPLNFAELDSSAFREYTHCLIKRFIANERQSLAIIKDAELLVTSRRYRMRSNYFESELMSCQIKEKIEVRGSPFAPEIWEDSDFLVVDVKVKNIDREARIPMNGEAIIITSDGEYRFDTAESVMAPGYGLQLTSLNPMIKARAKIVYRIPEEFKGDIYWQPGRNDDKERLWCGHFDIK